MLLMVASKAMCGTMGVGKGPEPRHLLESREGDPIFEHNPERSAFSIKQVIEG